METITPKRKAPTKAEAMKALIEMERKLMVKENAEASLKKAEALQEFKTALTSYFLENVGTLKSHLNIPASTYDAQVQFRFSLTQNNETMSLPPHLASLHKKWKDINERPCGYNPDQQPVREIRKRIEDKLKRVSADAVINGNNCAQVERTPVVKEYLEEFLASLTKASKAAERLAA